MAMGPLRAGLLRHVVRITRPTRGSDGKGAFVNDWALVGDFAAMVEGLDGREALIASALQGISAFRVTTRWNAALADADVTSWQITLADGRLLNVRSCNDPDGRRLRLEFLAETGTAIAEGA